MAQPLFSATSKHMETSSPSRSSKPNLPKLDTELTDIDSQVANYEEACDVLIIGSGATGLVAALRAHTVGLKPIIIEKSTQIGGSSAYSGGSVWVPNNHISRAAGNLDSFSEALEYMETIIGDVGPASSQERKMAFLSHGPEMVRFLDELGFKWISSNGYPDYYPEKAGGSLNRSIEPGVFDTKLLGDWEPLLKRSSSKVSKIAFHAYETRYIVRCLASWEAFRVTCRVMGRTIGRAMIGQRPVSGGKSLVAQLMLLNKTRGTLIWRETSLVECLTESGRVTGAVLMRNGKKIRVKASKGVLLCAGGFAKNAEMREKYQEAPVGSSWTSVPAGDTGDAITVGQAVGGAVALMDDAWWGPTVVDPATGDVLFSVPDRSLPHGIIVDSRGERFMNEATSYTDCGHAQYERHKIVSAIPAWLIVDSQYRKRYFLAAFPPRRTPRSALDSGWVKKADSIQELAGKINVDSGGLISTVEKFNKMAAFGVDEDYGRGGSAYDRFWGDPNCKPNPNLGPLSKGPFFAIEMWPGDVGTKGGLLTDEFARVLKDDGSRWSREHTRPCLYICFHRHKSSGREL